MTKTELMNRLNQLKDEYNQNAEKQFRIDRYSDELKQAVSDAKEDNPGKTIKYMSEDGVHCLVDELKEYPALQSVAIMYNKCIDDKPTQSLASIEATIKDTETAYTNACKIEFYEKVTVKGDESASIEAAIRQYEFKTLKHKYERKTVEIGEKKHSYNVGLKYEDESKYLNLLDYCKYEKFNTDWQFTVHRLNKVLALRSANSLELTATAIKKIDDSFAMGKLAADINLGKTPTSTTQVCKQLQKTINSILFMEDDKGLNKLKAINPDVKYLDICHTKRGKTPLKPTVTTNNQLIQVITDIIYRLLNGYKYDLDYKAVKAK